MRNITVTCDFVRRVHNHDTLATLCEHSGKLAQDCRLADAWSTEQQNTVPRHREIFDNTSTTRHCAADSASKAYDRTCTISDGGYSMEGTLYPRTIVVPKWTYSVDDVLEIFRSNLSVPQVKIVRRQAGFWKST
jgi:hypothetical protein